MWVLDYDSLSAVRVGLGLTQRWCKTRTRFLLDVLNAQRSCWTGTRSTLCVRSVGLGLAVRSC